MRLYRKPLELFCDICDTATAIRHHKYHAHNLVTDSYAKHYQRSRECLSPVTVKKEALKKPFLL